MKLFSMAMRIFYSKHYIISKNNMRNIQND